MFTCRPVEFGLLLILRLYDRNESAANRFYDNDLLACECIIDHVFKDLLSLFYCVFHSSLIGCVGQLLEHSKSQVRNALHAARSKE